jgi:hypothetical protein
VQYGKGTAVLNFEVCHTVYMITSSKGKTTETLERRAAAMLAGVDDRTH